MHKYDNQDHAMLTGLMAARNIMGGSFDLWRVNSDAEYLEKEAGGDAVIDAIERTAAIVLGAVGARAISAPRFRAAEGPMFRGSFRSRTS
jgi:hypothetical protein